MVEVVLECKSNSVCISSISYTPYKTTAANVLLCCSEDALDFLLVISSAQDDLKFIDLYV